MIESLAILYGALPYLFKGVLVTVSLVVGAMGLGLLFGIALAVGQVYGAPWTTPPHRLLCVVFSRCSSHRPSFSLLLWAFHGAGHQSLGLHCIDHRLGLISAALPVADFRGAILSLPAGQLKAARALGMSDARAIISIILPQALRLSIPGWSNEYSIVLKDSAVTYALGVMEVMARAHFIASRTYEHLPLYFAAGVIFLMLTFWELRGSGCLRSGSVFPVTCGKD